MSVKAFVLPVLTLTACVPLIAQRNIFRTRVDPVVVPVSVRDANGNFVEKLGREDFRVAEDGRPQEIRSVSSDTMPLCVAVLIDAGRGTWFYREFGESIGSLGAAFPDADEAAVYAFDPAINRISGFTSAREELTTGFGLILKMGGAVEPKNRTLNDALVTAAIDLAARPSDRRKIIVIIGSDEYEEPAQSSLPLEQCGSGIE